MSEQNPTISSGTLAVLIDADNASPDVIEGLLAEIAKYGTASVKRIYGNWTNQQLAGWKEELLKHSIQPVQQFAYTTGKNATDSAMIIDAMDLLYTGRFSGFCLVSSDSDFTRLASRIREQGLTVYGFGKKQTPTPFVAACDKFIFTELLKPEKDKPGAAPGRKAGAELRKDSGLINRLDQVLKDSMQEEAEWAVLSTVRNLLVKQMPEFDPRNYGYAKFSGLIEAIGLYEIQRNENTVLMRRVPKK